MRRQSYTPYIFLVCLLFCVFSIPPKKANKIRASVIGCIAPSFEGVSFLKSSIFKLLVIAPRGASFQDPHQIQEIEELKSENLSLKRQIDSMREYLLFEDRIDEQVEKLKLVQKNIPDDLFYKEFFRRRSEEISSLIDLQIRSMPAKVIFREPGARSSILWLGVGEKDNELLGARIVAVGSPVVIGTSVVGAVEEVGYKQCKVRLITDSGLVPSVRTTRGSLQNHYLLERLEDVLTALELREDLFSSRELQIKSLLEFNRLKNLLSQNVNDRFLAKGELRGSKNPFFRMRGQTLKGIGFNYDFPDEEGLPRDLRTGDILRVGDLLITTGYDGIFPPGLDVAIVSKIGRLKEGASSYEIEARLTCGNLDELSHFLVLPPIGFENNNP